MESQTLRLIVIEMTAGEPGTSGLQHKLSFIDTSILDSWISTLWILNVSFRRINKETRLFFGENLLRGYFVRRGYRLPKGTDYSLLEVPHFPGYIYLVWNPVSSWLLYARNRKVYWRILFIWSLRPTLLRRWNLFY